MQLHLIPQELRQYAQWVAWKFEQTNGGKATKIPYDVKTGWRASVTNSATWSSFDEAANVFNRGGYAGIGFVLCRNDPFSFIDLDNPGDDPAIVQSHNFIYKQFSNTYAELSPSGTGVHIIGKGTLPSACKRHKVEIYDNERYMTVTGDVLNPAPISDVQQLLWQLYNDIGGRAASKVSDIEDQAATLEDNAVWWNAASAENGALFKQLWVGDWSNYPSQSEADFALVDFLQFHSGNIDQIARMFRASGLGGREKALRDDYVMRMVAKSFDRARMYERAPTQEFVAAQAAEVRSWQEQHKETEEQKLQPIIRLLPQGIIMDIASYIYNAAPRPLAEGAILGAITLLGGMAGRAYNVSGDLGLNHYLLLLAKTGTGKESVKEGIDRIIEAIKPTVPAVERIRGPGAFASGQAVVKWMADQQRYCLFSIFGEFGHDIQSLSYPTSSLDIFKRKVLLDLYTKNGRGKVLGETAYSDHGKNIAPINSPSFTLFAEAEPIGFLNGLDKSLIEGGLIPRFLIVEHETPRTPFNENRLLDVPYGLIFKLGQLLQISFQVQQQQKWVDIPAEPIAQKMLDDYRDYADENGQADVEAHVTALWSRAHMRAIKLAGTASLDNPEQPIITIPMAEWAIETDKYYVEKYLARVERGDIGTPVSEVRQEQLVYQVIARYLELPYENLTTGKDRIKPEMKRDNVISHAYISNNVRSKAPFANARIGGKIALKNVVENIISTGDLSKPINPEYAEKAYGTGQLMYKVNNVTSIMERGKK